MKAIIYSYIDKLYLIIYSEGKSIFADEVATWKQVAEICQQYGIEVEAL